MPHSKYIFCIVYLEWQVIIDFYAWLLLQVVRRKYQQEYDIAPPITFGADHVALDIPDDGVQTDSGWEIVPVQRTQVNSNLLAF